MKKILLSLLLALTFLAPSCIRRTVIPDDELALIFRDAFLVNAYVLNAKFDIDTLQIYQPIFDKYGYTSDDVSYTVGSFSKRKSARLSDVVEQSIKLLEAQADVYSHETMILDSIEARALRYTTKDFYYNERVEFYSMRDTSKLEIILEDLTPGSYRVTFDYLVDSLDNNVGSYRAMNWVVKPGTEEKRGLSSTFLRKGREGNYVRTLELDTLTSKVILLLADSYEAKRTPHVTFNDIRVSYTPPVDIAVDKLFKDKLDIRIFADDLFDLQPTDSLELSTL